jgi:hypothetical protein
VVEGVGHSGSELYYVLAAECLRLLDLGYPAPSHYAMAWLMANLRV